MAGQAEGVEEDLKPLDEAQQTFLKKGHLLGPVRLSRPQWAKEVDEEDKERRQSRASAAVYLGAERQKSKGLEEAEEGAGSAVAGERGRV